MTSSSEVQSLIHFMKQLKPLLLPLNNKLVHRRIILNASSFVFGSFAALR